ncbi:MAG: hypothetical protein WCG52_09590 [bacterium]|jgi:hypothetical protein|nr:hypothetical protein [bacterium]PAW80667.1 MAG: hypothetical protein B9S31_04005 [Spartobacteria bacterium Tous-C9RFEB]
MSQLSLDKFGENLPVSGIVGFSQVAIGLGAGFLVAESIGQNARRSAGIALVGLGVAALVPIIWGITSKISSRPESSRAMRKRLEGIRGEYDAAQ